MWSFYKALLKNPRAIGSVIPSSSHLAQALAKFIPSHLEGLILELGAGTGVITQAIRNTGIADDRLIAVENSPGLAAKLSQRFPDITVLNKNACELTPTLGHLAKQVDIVISSLPLLSLPASTRRTIIQEIATILKPNSYYIQYTYRKSLFDNQPRFHKIASKRIWYNIPPACIDVYTLSD